MPDLDKILVAPQIVIYKNLLKNSKHILDVLKRSEFNYDSNSFFPKWEEWRPTNNTPGSLLKVRIVDRDIDIHEGDSEVNIEQKKVVYEVYEAFNIAVNDFIKDWAGKGIWPNFITNWDVSDKSFWQNHEFDVLTYSQMEDQHLHDPSSGVYNLPMNYHVDCNPAIVSGPGTKLSITVTMYLNDEYHGGEISFYSDSDNKVYNYKPKPGDITVFPSFQPFYHGVLPMSGNPRYLIRSFLMYNRDEDKEWSDKKSKYSDEEWDNLEKQNIYDAYRRGDHCLRIIYDGDVLDNIPFRSVFIKELPIEIKE
jgi:hypothetical protein